MHTKSSKDAAEFWHARIGRFLSASDWQHSLSASYPCFKGDGKPIQMRLGACLASSIMVDDSQGVLIDKLNLKLLPSLLHEECNFKYGEHIKGVVNLAKTQIEWAIAEERVFPLLLIRPGKKNPMACLQLSYGPDSIEVCIPTGRFSFDGTKVRHARDYIVANGLEKLWRKAADLRQMIGMGDHLVKGIAQRNKLVAEHADMLASFPLDQWLPMPGTGDHAALGECLAEKPALDLSSLTTARSQHIQLTEAHHHVA